MIFRKHFGIKLKITVAFSLVFILLSSVFNFFGYRQIRTLLIEDNNRYLLSRANGLLDKTELSPVIIPLPDKNAMIRVFYHSGNKPYTVFESPGIIKKIRAPVKTGVNDTLGMRVAYVISNNEENPAELMLATSADHLNKNLNYLLILLFACSVISVIIAGLVAYVLAFYLLQPLQKIINATKAITTNQLHDVIPVKYTNDELQELTETINGMLKRIDTSLQQQQNFFASASHELKTPLAILRAELEVGLKKEGLGNEISALLKSQLTEIDSLQQTVQEFLVISQLKSGGIVLFTQPLDISSIVLKLFNRVPLLLKQKNVVAKIDFDKESDNFMINADHDKLSIALANILDNAIKYSVENTTVICRVQKPAGNKWMTISFTNTISKHSIPTEKLREAFYREEALPNSAGLGLWLCNEIIALHHGKVEITSSNFLFEAVVYLPSSS